MVKVEVNFNPGKDSKLNEKVKRDKATNSSPMHFTWNKLTHHAVARIVLTADTPDFDPTTIDNWKDEGFAIAYIPYQGDLKTYHKSLLSIADSLQLGDKYAIVSYGEAAAACLEICQKPLHKLTTLIAYYPPSLPKSPTVAAFPPSLTLQVHLAGTPPQTQLYTAALKTPPQLYSRHVYHYPSTSPGFAEYDLYDTFSKPASRLAWSRSLDAVRRGFNMNALSHPSTCDLETIWDRHTALEFREKDAEKTLATMTAEPYVNHVPTMTGGIGRDDLLKFYSDYFIPCNPPDTAMKLLSRTVGTDRVVDEMEFSFTHTTAVPWMLPGVPPTGKKVEVALVSVVCIRGGKLYHEHIYWDQASVLVQVGLLDPGLVPKGFKTTEEGREGEVKRLPVVGREAVMKVVDEESVESNTLIPDWEDE